MLTYFMTCIFIQSKFFVPLHGQALFFLISCVYLNYICVSMPVRKYYDISILIVYVLCEISNHMTQKTY